MERSYTIEQFLNVFPDKSVDAAIQFLDASGWDLAAAIESVLVPPSSLRPTKRGRTEDEASGPVGGARDWESKHLRCLYRPPLELIYKGSYEQAKEEACVRKKWVLVNLQSRREFDSHLLNRDTWANDAVAQIIPSHFVFWQEYEDDTEGKKVCTYHEIDSLPAVLVIDSITGKKMRCWQGMVEPQRLLEDLMPFLENNPFEYFRKAQNGQASRKKKTHGTEQLSPSRCVDNKKRATYPTLPEEPEGDRSLICRIAVRLPDGGKRLRKFLPSDPVQLLWSFCDSLLEEQGRPFQLKLATPGSPHTLDYHSNLTFQESELSNSLITIAWE